MMKLSFTTMATPTLRIDEAIEVAKAYGFHGIDFRVMEQGNGEIDRTITAEEAERIQGCLGNIKLPSLLCYNKKVNDGRVEMVDSILEYIQLANKLNIPVIRIFTGKLKDEQLPELIGILCEILERDGSKVILGMQNHLGQGISPVQALKVCKTLNSNRVKLIFSPEQAIMAGQKFEEIMEELAPYIVQVYVADIDKAGQYVLPRKGVVEFEKIFRILYSHDFSGYVTLKWEKCWKPELPEYPVAFDAFMKWVSDIQMN